jgi:hypothetical protein
MRIAALVLMFGVLLFVFGGCSNTENQKQSTQPPVGQVTESTQKIVEKEQVSKEKPVVDIPAILKQKNEDVNKTLGKPKSKEIKGQDKVIETYSLTGYDIDITYFMGTPSSIDITPLKKYKFIKNNAYTSDEVPDDIKRLLKELGFNGLTPSGSTPMQSLFLYTDFSTLREYEIRVNSKDWRAVDEGKESEVDWVYVKLTKTR